MSRKRIRYSTLFFLVTAAIVGVIFAIFQTREFSKQRSIASVPEPSPVRITSLNEPVVCKTFYKVICKSADRTRRDPTGFVRPDVEGERIVAAMYEELIRDHPGWTAEQVDDALTRQVYTPERRGRIEAAYRWVQDRMTRFIDSQPDRVFNSSEKKILENRIKGTILDIPPPASVYADEPDLLTKNDVFYERTSNGVMRMRVGGAYLFTAKSWFNMVFTMGHELGHAIDPCEVRAARLSFPAYDRLEACFLKTGIVAMTKTRSECDDNDQLSEAFADWIGTQVTSEALKLFATDFHGTQLVSATSNAVRDLCDEGDGEDLDEVTHPAPKVRIEKIFGEQPSIQTLLGCAVPPPTAVPYCGFDSDVSKFPPTSHAKVSQ